MAQASVPAFPSSAAPQTAGTEAGATPSASSHAVAQASLPAVTGSAVPQIAGTEASTTVPSILFSAHGFAVCAAPATGTSR